MSKVISISRLEAIVVKDDSSDVMKHCKIACAQVKAKLNIDKFVTPISWIKMPFGSVVVVEVPQTGSHVVGAPPMLGERTVNPNERKV